MAILITGGCGYIGSHTCIELIKAGKLDLKGTISHTYPFLEAQKAFDFVDTKDPSIRKVVLTFD